MTKEGVQALIAEAAELTKQEKGCLAYEWHLSEDGKSVHAYERYTDSEAAMVHVNDTFSKISEKVTKVMTPTGLTIYGEAIAKPEKDLVPSISKGSEDLSIERRSVPVRIFM